MDEELSVQETPQDAFRNPEDDEDTSLELLQTQSSPEARQATDPDSKTLPVEPGNQGLSGPRLQTKLYGPNWTRT
ncbi:hypothetical protein DPMN_092219 [Dreissena polymorpha]|uniref:Uncharacterized protein n=1 Tax=Dreissena polymorpha TaxID=45954 RepID=A0A9D4L0X8_DREPO|nr:hypothetical protein DPMN_092219 [Dreissena polymorpha]